MAKQQGQMTRTQARRAQRKAAYRKAHRLAALSQAKQHNGRATAAAQAGGSEHVQSQKIPATDAPAAQPPQNAAGSGEHRLPSGLTPAEEQRLVLRAVNNKWVKP